MKFAAWLLAFATLSPLAAAQIPQTQAPQTQPSQFDLERRVDLQKVESDATRLPVMRIDAIDQVVTFSLEEGMLDARTPVPVQANETRLIIPGRRGVVSIKFFGRRRGEDPGDYYFSVTNADLTDPIAGEVYTTISSAAGHFMLTRESEAENKVLSVQLIQDAPPIPGEALAQPQEPPVKLYLSDQRSQGQPLKLKLMARDFVILRLEHPDEIDRYLRPILRDLGQEKALFTLPRTVAWEIIGLDYVPDEAMRARIGAILSRLDADDFQKRQQASDELKQLGPLAQLSLATIDKSRLTFQQRSEIAAILEQSAPMSTQTLRPVMNQRNLLIDMLYTDDADLQRLALERLSKIERKTIKLDSANDAGIEKLRQELNPTTQQNH